MVFPFFDSHSVYYGDPTLIFIPHGLRDIIYLWEKQFLKNFNYIGGYANFCAQTADFSLSDRPKASLIYPSIISLDLQASQVEILFF